jgi:formate hydrogenlyase subunit 3/multisubunit Na+/H+ antiporter MnhD subunit
LETSILCVPVFLPLIVGFIILLLPNKLSSLFRALTVIISVVTFVLGISIFTSGGSDTIWPVLQLGQIELQLMLTAAPLGKFMLLFAMGFGLLITIYSLRSRTADDDQRNANIYYGATLLTIGGTAGILLSNQLLFLLIFWEFVTVSLYLLISTGRSNSNFAATKSFAMIGASDAAFMLGVFFVWVCSNVDVAQRTFVISKMSIATTSPLPIIAFLLLLLAAITKAGALPLHTWVPTSGEYAPASVMALLPAAIDKLLGIYLLLIIVKKIFIIQTGALSLLLAIIGAATIIIAVMIAMVQHNLKKLLSYHAVSQVGYMILGIATGTPVGIAGGVFHLLNNAIYKSCLFLCGGAVEQQTGTADLEELGGLGRKMPWTFVTCLIAALSISGIPPFNGFVSKWMVYQGVIKMGSEQAGTTAGLWPLWLVAAMFGSALTLASFVKIIHSMFLSRLPSALKDIKEVSALQIFPMVVLAGLCVIFGIFYYQVPLKMFIYPLLPTLTGSVEQPVLSIWSAGLATILIVVGIGIGLLIWFIGRLSNKIRIVPTWTCGEIQDNDRMIIPGTHFYKTVSSMDGLKQLYIGQERGYFDAYDQGGRCGLGLTAFLRWLHSGILPIYLTWLTIGLLIVLFVVCGIW